MKMTEEPKLSYVRKIFRFCQATTACHLKHALELKKAIESKDEDREGIKCEIITCINMILMRPLPRSQKTNEQRVLEFVGVLCSQLQPEEEAGQMHPFVREILLHLVEVSKANGEHFCYWSCLAIWIILHQLEFLDRDLHDIIKEEMFERTQISKSAVRHKCVRVQLCLIDFAEDEAVVESLNNIVNTEMIAKIRQLVVEHLPITQQTSLSVLGRIRDVDENVRLAAFKRCLDIAEFLKVDQRRNVLLSGLLDESVLVKEFVSKTLIPTWLINSYENNCIKFLNKIRLDANEDDVRRTVFLAGKVLNVFFEKATIDEILQHIEVNSERLIEFQNLNWDTVLYYKIVIDYFRELKGFDESLNKILPELVFFCRYIKSYFCAMKDSEDKDQFYFTLKQFFLITRGYDFGDSVSRQALNSLIIFVLESGELPCDVNEVILENLQKTITNENAISLFVCEIIFNILCGINTEENIRLENERAEKISELKDKIALLEEQKKKCVMEKMFLEADRFLKESEEMMTVLQDLTQQTQEQPERKSDLPTLVRCLRISKAFLRSSLTNNMTPALENLKTELISSCLTQHHPQIRLLTFECFACVCLIDEESAKQGIHLFVAVANSYLGSDPRLTSLCLEAVADILSRYGSVIIENPDDDIQSNSYMEEEKKVFVGGTSWTDILKTYSILINEEDPELQLAAAKGIGVLLYVGFQSSVLFSTLIIKWANPITDHHTLAVIGWILEQLQKRQLHDYLTDGIIRTVKTLSNAPENSPLAGVDLDNIMKFFVSFITASSDAEQAHHSLILRLCSELFQYPQRLVNDYFTKMLLLLRLPTSLGCLEEIEVMCQHLQKKTFIKRVKKKLEKFVINLAMKKGNVELTNSSL